MKIAVISCVLFTSLIPALPPQRADVAKPALQPCPNVIVHEPILLYEIAGSTLAAQVDRTLTVYADGSLKLSDASATGPGQSYRVHTTPEVVGALQVALVQAGGLALCDDTQLVTDVPLHTLTMLRGAQNARAHTFSYWTPDANYGGVDGLLEGFIADFFAGF